MRYASILIILLLLFFAQANNIKGIYTPDTKVNTHMGKVYTQQQTLYDYEKREINLDRWSWEDKKIDTTFSLPEPNIIYRAGRERGSEWEPYGNPTPIEVTGYYGVAEDWRNQIGDGDVDFYYLPDTGDNYAGTVGTRASPYFTIMAVIYGVGSSTTDYTLKQGWTCFASQLYGNPYRGYSLYMWNKSGLGHFSIFIANGNTYSAYEVTFPESDFLGHWIIAFAIFNNDTQTVTLKVYNENGLVVQQTYDTVPINDYWSLIYVGNPSWASSDGSEYAFGYIDTIMWWWQVLPDIQIEKIVNTLAFFRHGIAYYRKTPIEGYDEISGSGTVLFTYNVFAQQSYKDALYNTVPLYLYIYVNMTNWVGHGYDLDWYITLFNLRLSTISFGFAFENVNWQGTVESYLQARYDWYGVTTYWFFLNKNFYCNGYSLNKTYPLMFKITLNGTHINVTNYYGKKYIIQAGAYSNLEFYFPVDSIVIASKVDLGELDDVFTFASSSSNVIYYGPLGTPIVPQDNQVLTRNLYIYNRLDEYTILNISNYRRSISILVAPHVAFTLSLPIAEYIINNQILYLDRDYTIYLEEKAYRLYISFFNMWTGLGVDYDTFITYVNGHRAYYPEIALTQPLANILVYDFFGRLLYNETIIFNETEYYVGIGIYITTLAINNQANYSVRVNITFSSKSMSLELGPSMSWIVELVSDKYNITIEKKLENGTYIPLNENATEVDLSQVSTATLTIKTDLAEVVTPIENYTIYNNMYNAIQQKMEEEAIKWALYGALSGLASAIVFTLYWWALQRKKKKIYVIKVSPF